MILPFARVRVTSAASRQSSHFTRSIEASCSHDSSVNGPSVTMFFGSVQLSPNCSTVARMDRQERGVADLLDEPGLRRRELDLEGRVVESLDPDLVGKRVAALLAGVVVGGADDPVELVRVVGGELGRDRPLPRIFEVLRGDRVAVRPLPVRAEVERHGLSVLAHVPALGEAGHGRQVVPQLHERVHDVQEDVRRRRVGRQARVERRRLGPPAHCDDLIRGRLSAGATACGRRAAAALIAAATGGRENGGREDRQ